MKSAPETSLPHKATATLARVCTLVGCSGFSRRCPGDPSCDIVRKVATATK